MSEQNFYQKRNSIMDFYIFSDKINEVEELVNHGYSGCLFIYNKSSSDFFTQISRTIVEKQKFKYMVAIRPYTISPQYLCKINNSINNIDKDRLEINFITGYRYAREDRTNSGGVLGSINDPSPTDDKANYLIEYIDVLEKIDEVVPDYYLSVANKDMVNKTLKHNSKLLIEYQEYKDKIYNIENRNVMVYFWAILRETKEELEYVRKHRIKEDYEYFNILYFTHKEFNDIIDELKNKGINKILLYTNWIEKERSILNNFVKQYKEKENK
jgi:hypothetical protein